MYYCHDGNGRVLFSKRGQTSRDEIGRWDIGGGGVEFGETIDETLRKEVKEEYNANVLSYEFLGYRDVHREHEAKKTHWIALDFKVLVDPTGVKNNEPHKFDEIGWFQMGNFPQPQHSQFPEFLRLYKDKLK